MAHEILSVKLCELDEKIGKMHGRIRISETMSHAQLQRVIENLKKECMESHLLLRNRLEFSRSPMVKLLADPYREIGQMIQSTKQKLEAFSAYSTDTGSSVDEKLLFAEYAIDFAMQAADQALLVSMEALEAQMERHETEEAQA